MAQRCASSAEPALQDVPRERLRHTGQNLVAYGHTVAINDKIKAQRKELGLDEVPPTVLANEKAMADLSEILEATGFKKLVE